jgi:hypothetical protein
VCEGIRLGHKDLTYDPLRKMMLEELERRNYAQTKIDCYIQIQTIEDFARYFRRPPDQLTPEHVRDYQAYLFRERKLAAHRDTTVGRSAVLKAWSVADTPYPKKTRYSTLPGNSEERQARYIEAAVNGILITFIPYFNKFQ